MKTISASLSAHRQSSSSVVIVGLYTIKTVTGIYLRYTDGDAPIRWGGHLFAVGPAIRRTALSWRAGMQVDECTLTISPSSTDMVGTRPLGVAIRQGDLDGAAVRIEKAYIDPASLPAAQPVPLDVVVAMVGRVAQVRGFAQFAVAVKSLLSLLDQPFPRVTYQPACANVLFDGQCRLSPATYLATGAVSAVSGASFATGLTQPNDYFRWGVLKWLTGANAGRAFTVLAHTQSGGMITLSRATPSPISAGDTFEVTAGCDRTLATCGSKFSNTDNFAGQPFIPAPESVV